MPVVLERLSRRGLLGAALAAAVGAVGRPWLALGADDAAVAEVDPHRFALLSDTHIPAEKGWAHKRTGIKPWEHIFQVRKEVLALKPRPAGVLVCGDCANARGTPEEYAAFLEAVKPLREAGLPLHLALGNHDQRRNFLKAMPADDARRNAVNGRYVGMVRAPRANWFVLDSLEITKMPPGSLGTKQLEWLVKVLDANADKPALIVVHHHPDRSGMLGGLRDTDELIKVLQPRKQVKAWIYGHTHAWQHIERDGVHYINLPATAWLFAPEMPAGWVDVKLQEDGAVFEMMALKKEHPQHGEKVDLKWRPAK